jgi:hypothetical protein
MLLNKLVPGIAFAAVLSACATSPPPPPPPAPPPTLASLLRAAEAAIASGKPDVAGGWLKSAIAAFPADKAPRLRMAQLQFACQNYGDTITRAQEVLERDPDDLVAHSLVAVSGLRVSSKALSDLAAKNRLSGDVRAEATDLARILRANIGGELIPPVRKQNTAALRPGAQAPAPRPPRSDALNDWLSGEPAR